MRYGGIDMTNDNVIGTGFEIVNVGKCDIYFDLWKEGKLTTEDEYEIKDCCHRAAELLIKKINSDFDGD